MARPRKTNVLRSRGGKSFGVAITVREVERRILRACQTLRAMPDPDRRFQWIGAAWPEVVRSAEDAYGYTDEVMPKFRPSPADVSDYLNALAWARVLNWREFKLIWWRSFDVSFRHIGLRIHKSDETARRQYRDALLGIWHEANRTNQAGALRVFSGNR